MKNNTKKSKYVEIELIFMIFENKKNIYKIYSNKFEKI